jgi:hypothetical protein
MEMAKDSVELSNTSQTNANNTPYPDDVQSAWEMYLVINDGIIKMRRERVSQNFFCLNEKVKYPINTDSPIEMEKRKENFVKSHAIIQEHNKNKTATFQMGHNQFSVMVRLICD